MCRHELTNLINRRFMKVIPCKLGVNCSGLAGRGAGLFGRMIPGLYEVFQYALSLQAVVFRGLGCGLCSSPLWIFCVPEKHRYTLSSSRQGL